MIYNPTVIIRCLSSQAVYFNRKYRQMFYYSDQNQLWYDTQDNNRILVTDIKILQFERQRNNYVPNLDKDYPTEYGYQTPTVLLQEYSMVYVIETNCLYKYEKGVWQTVYGKFGQRSVAQTYYPDGTARVVVADDVTTNGILNDGSVVVRDGNKMICGILRSDGYTLNVLGLIGGCVNIDPSGSVNGDGCLQLNANPGLSTQPDANLNSNLIVFGDIKSVSPTNWNKQYRLVTENLLITTNTVVKAGSTLTAGSKLGETVYDKDTIIDSDITVEEGNIQIGSKLYKGSYINDTELVPPYLFDIENVEKSYLPKAISALQDAVSVKDTTLIVDVDFSFVNDGDCCYISVPSDLSNITKVQFNHGFEYDVDYVAKEGIDNTAKICYYALNNKVKVLP